MANLKPDVFGSALWDYQQNPSPAEMITWTSLTEEDPINVSYFFRTFNQMPKLEQEALRLSRGKVLDIGCGSGSHSLYLQNEMKFDVVGIDISPGAIATARARGLNNAIEKSIFDYGEGTFDTLLLLMNGPGICGKLKDLKNLFEHLVCLLNPEGQILLDSSDLIYLFDETDRGEKIIPASKYYGELEYGIRYKNKTSIFPWLYVDFNNLQFFAGQAGLNAELILSGNNWDYLARLTKEY